MLESIEFLIYCLLSRNHSRKCTQNREHTHSQFIRCIRIMFCTYRMETFFGNKRIKCAYYWLSIDVFLYKFRMAFPMLNVALLSERILEHFTHSFCFLSGLHIFNSISNCLVPFNHMREERFFCSYTFCTITLQCYVWILQYVDWPPRFYSLEFMMKLEESVQIYLRSDSNRR